MFVLGCMVGLLAEPLLDVQSIGRSALACREAHMVTSIAYT